METATKNATLQGEWAIDHSHSNLNFKVKHLVISTVTGSFGQYSGKISSKGERFEDAQIEFQIEVDSISTGNEQRDGHLKSDDFFNAEAHPQIHFRSKEIKALGDDRYAVSGELQIRETRQQESFTIEIGGMAVDGYGNTKLGLSASTRINRFDYGLKWNQLTEAGGATVGKEVRIDADLQFVKQ